MDIGKVMSSLDHLALRIDERFKDSGLASVCRELHSIATQSSETLSYVSKPIWWLRLSVILLLVLVLFIVAGLVSGSGLKMDNKLDMNLSNIVQLFESLVNDLVFIFAAIWFLTRIENRIKRRRILSDLHELRIIAHVIDMHQLTKDTMNLNSLRTRNSPKRDLKNEDLCRYLEYCIEMLSLNSKVAASYANEVDDELVLNSINEIEEMTSGLSNKISQKMMMVGSRSPYDRTDNPET